MSKTVSSTYENFMRLDDSLLRKIFNKKEKILKILLYFNSCISDDQTFFSY